jgi:TolB-like protein
MAQRFGPFVLDADAGLLTKDGVPVPLGHRGLVLLDVLVRSAGRAVGKAELLEAAWPSLAVEESNLTVQMSALRRLIGVQPDGGDWIATVPRVGYRFAGADLLLSVAAKGSEDSRPTIAVLPFASLSEDPEQSYFAEGLTDDIVAGLARLTWLNVTARAFAAGRRFGEASRELRDLGVRYVLEGSVRRSGDGMRIVCRLSEAESGRQVWTDTRNVHVSDFLTLQDAIAEAVIAAIEPRLYAVEYEHVRARPPESLDAWGLVVKAMPAVWTWGTVEAIVRAEVLLERAIRLEPDYARANSLLAWARGARVHLDPWWARQEDPHRRLSRHAHRQRGLLLAAVLLVVGDALGHPRLLRADLLRLQRVQRHRHRGVAAARLPAP